MKKLFIIFLIALIAFSGFKLAQGFVQDPSGICVFGYSAESTFVDRVYNFVVCPIGSPILRRASPSSNASGTIPQRLDNSKIIKSGIYTCSSCEASHAWYINDKHLMYWDGVPYIPVGMFWTDRLSAPPEITDWNIWIDTDFKEIEISAEEDNFINRYFYYFKKLDRETTDITKKGNTYTLLIAYPPRPQKDASWLFDKTKVESFTSEWSRYALFVRKEGLRGVVLFNEINSNDSWDWKSSGHTADEYGNALGDLAKKAKAIFGDVPIHYKTLGTHEGFSYVYAGATNADGLGYDIYPLNGCTARGLFDEQNQKEITALKDKITSSRQLLGLLWITEAGKMSGAPNPQTYLEYFAPFTSKTEMKCYFDNLLKFGFTGFYLTPSAKKISMEQFQWFGELKSYLESEVLKNAE